jgi:hypothetical protein
VENEISCLVLVDREMEGHNKATVAFHNFLTHFKIGSTSTEYLPTFRPSCTHSSRYTLISVSYKQLYTLSVGWHKHVVIEKTQFHVSRWRSEIQFHCGIVRWHFYYVTTISSWYFQFIFFSNYSNYFFCSLISVCTTKPEHAATKFSSSNKKRSRNFKR